MVPCQSRWSCVRFSTRRGVGSKPRDAVELEAGQLEHPDLGRHRAASRPGRRRSRRPACPAASGRCCRRPRRACRALDQQAGQRGRRGLAVGAGDGEHLRRVAALGAQAARAPGRTGRARLHRHAGLRARRRAAPRCARRAAPGPGSSARGRRRRAASSSGAADETRRRGTAAPARRLAAARRACRQTRTCGALARAPARHRQARLAEAEDEAFAVHVHHRSFRVDRPTRHSSIVMIQKRTTTCVSFQPVFSKWWCSGAIFRMRRPSP